MRWCLQTLSEVMSIQNNTSTTCYSPVISITSKVKKTYTAKLSQTSHTILPASNLVSKNSFSSCSSTKRVPNSVLSPELNFPSLPIILPVPHFTCVYSSSSDVIISGLNKHQQIFFCLTNTLSSALYPFIPFFMSTHTNAASWICIRFPCFHNCHSYHLTFILLTLNERQSPSWCILILYLPKNYSRHLYLISHSLSNPSTSTLHSHSSANFFKTPYPLLSANATPFQKANPLPWEQQQSNSLWSPASFFFLWISIASRSKATSKRKVQLSAYTDSSARQRYKWINILRIIWIISYIPARMVHEQFSIIPNHLTLKCVYNSNPCCKSLCNHCATQKDRRDKNKKDTGYKHLHHIMKI